MSRIAGLIAAPILAVMLLTLSASWAFVNLRSGLTPGRIESAAQDILRGGKFDAATLDLLSASAASLSTAQLAARPSTFGAAAPGCRPKLAQAAAIIAIQRAEIALESEVGPQPTNRFQPTEIALEAALRCSPADGFLWYALAWLTSVSSGDAKKISALLRHSYRTAPFEGWIVVRRNALILSLLDLVEPDIAALGRREFALIVDNGFYNEAYALLTGPGWPARETLLSSLGDARIVRRRNFARMLTGLDLAVPGVDMPEKRPWN